LLLRIPNPADPDVPVGDASANKVVRTWGEHPPGSYPERLTGPLPGTEALMASARMALKRTEGHPMIAWTRLRGTSRGLLP
jgi:seryl-tRNA synthetase